MHQFLAPLEPQGITPAVDAPSLVITAKQAPTALLERLIREVSTESQPGVAAYNRMHNRHNRGR